MKKLIIPKINSNNFGGKWILTAFIVGGIIPLLLWLLFHVFVWVLCVAGAIIFLGFILVFSIEMKQDFGIIPYYERHLKETITFDPQKQYAVIRSSICNGEKVAGFIDKENSHFTEVMLIKTIEDEERFKKIFNIKTVKIEY